MSTSNVNMKVLRSPFTPSIFIRIEEERRETMEGSVFSLQTFLTFSSDAFLYFLHSFYVVFCFHYWFRDDRTPVKIPTELFDDVVHRTVQYYTLRTYIHSYISTWAYVKKGRERLSYGASERWRRDKSRIRCHKRSVTLRSCEPGAGATIRVPGTVKPALCDSNIEFTFAGVPVFVVICIVVGRSVQDTYIHIYDTCIRRQYIFTNAISVILSDC